MKKCVTIFWKEALNRGGSSIIDESIATIEEDFDFRNETPSANINKFIESISFVKSYFSL